MDITTFYLINCSKEIFNAALFTGLTILVIYVGIFSLNTKILCLPI